MSPVDLGVLYGLVGAGCAIAVYARERAEGPRRALGSAALALALWPLWAPVALSRDADRRRPRSAPPGARREQIAQALREGVDAASGSPLEALLGPAAADQILGEVDRAEARRAELEALLARPELDVARARCRVEELAAQGATSRALATARLHLGNVERLVQLRDRDDETLDELLELTTALRTQLVLARYAGSSLEGAGGIVSEVWARVEGLSEAIDAQEDGVRAA